MSNLPTGTDALGQRLLDARNEKHLSRAGLAQQSGVSAATIVRAELKGHVPSVGNLMALARVLDLDLADLLASS